MTKRRGRRSARRKGTVPERGCGKLGGSTPRSPNGHSFKNYQVVSTRSKEVYWWCPNVYANLCQVLRGVGRRVDTQLKAWADRCIYLAEVAVRRADRIKSAKKIQVDLPEDLLSGLQRSVAASGQTQADWVRKSLRESISAQIEKQSAGKLDRMQDRLDAMQASQRKLADRIDDALIPIMRKIEQDSITRHQEFIGELNETLGGIGSSLTFIGQQLEKSTKILESQRLMIGAILVSSDDAVRRSLTTILADKDRLGQIVEEWRKA